VQGQAPEVPSSIASASVLKFTADGADWILSSDGNLTLPDDGYVQTYNGNITLLAADNRPWIFGSDGVLTMPDGNLGNDGRIDFNFEGYNWGRISNHNRQVYIQSVASGDTDPDGTVYSEVSVGLDVSISTNAQSQSNNWTFGLDGNLTVPGKITTPSVTGTGAISANLYIGAGTATGCSATGGSTIIQGGHGDIDTGGSGPVQIQTGSDTGNPDFKYTWTFDQQGRLLLPNAYSSGGTLMSADGFSFYNTNTFQYPRLDTANIIVPSNGSTDSIQVNNNNGNVQLSSNTNNWTFGLDGTLTLPASGNIVTTSGNLNITSTSGWVNITSGPHTFTFDADSVGRFIMPSQGVIAGNEDGVRVFAGNLATEAGNVWTFGYGGTLEIPDKGIIRTQNWDSFSLQSDNTNITIIPNVDQTQGWTFGYNGILTLPRNNYLQTIDTNLTVGSQGSVRINSNARTDSGTYGWVFGSDGNTTFPNGAKLNDGTAYQFATDNTVTTSLDLRDSAGRGFYTNSSGYTLRSNGSYNWIFGPNGELNLPISNTGNGLLQTVGNISILATSKTWTFSSQALLSLPDLGTVPTTEGSIGDLARNGDVLYFKTSTGWKTINLS
jgi:hypothetical protein